MRRNGLPKIKAARWRPESNPAPDTHRGTPVSFPAFHSQIPPIVLRDPLAEMLGAAADGLLTYRYEDAVRLAGHSCPTVAGAWLLARHGLAALYGEETPLRGGLQVQLREARDAGVAGVAGNVLGLITGAAGPEGFKGLGGRQSRRDLLLFNAQIAAEVRMTRLDTGDAVLLDYHPERMPPSPDLPPLMARMVGGTATAEEQAAFAGLWQDRVRRILEADALAAGLISLRR